MSTVHIFITDKSRNAAKARACDIISNEIDPALGRAVSDMLADGFELSDIYIMLHNAATVAIGATGLLRKAR